jgi:PAS domain S-box-containing protein
MTPTTHNSESAAPRGSGIIERWLSRPRMPWLFVPVVLLLGLVGPVIGSSYYVLKLEREALERAYHAETEQMVNVLAQGLEAPVWNLIPDAGRTLVHSMMEDDRVLSITVTSTAQGEFLAIARDAQAVNETAVATMTQKIVHEDHPIGLVTVRIDAEKAYEKSYFQSSQIYLANGIQLVFGIGTVILVIWILTRLQRAQSLRQTNAALQTEVLERARAEGALQASETRLLEAQRMAKLGHWTWHIREDKTFWSDEHFRIFGLPPSKAPIDADAFFAQVDEEDLPKVHDAVAACVRTGRPYELEYRITRSDGGRRVVLTRAELKRDAAGEPARLIGMLQDITERKHWEEALAESERLHRGIFDNMIDTFYRTDREGRIVMASPSAEALLGRKVEELLGRHMVEFYKNPADRDSFLEQMHATGGHVVGFETQLVRSNGEIVWVSTNAGFWKGPDGETMGVEGNARDITEQRRVAEQLRQAQKMEAVGQLTGGVAHDFNNILAVIVGNAELLGADEEESDPGLQSILRAALRGADLTQRLLAFSRRQALRPSPLGLGTMVDGMRDMLERSLGEQVAIEVRMEDDLWPCLCDRGQIENALLNLAINARDAMPGGGKLTISGRNVPTGDPFVPRSSDDEPGDFVELAVKDSGVGMSAEILEHAMEPFFTTKDVGEGSGLGLSMVYGFARQSGGHLTIDSETGAGTTVRLYLPRVAGDKFPEAESADAPADDQPGGGEKILVLEDDHAVRATTLAMLRDLGYRPFGVDNPEAARKVLAREADLFLMLCDVVLRGGENGMRFAEEIGRDRPDIKTILMSGYVGGMAGTTDGIRESATLLSKPIRKSALAAALKEVLGRGGRGGERDGA